MSRPFLETPRFPECYSYGSSGGPTYNTTNTRVKSGHESANRNWVYPLHKYNLSLNAKDNDETEELVRWFHNMAGMYYGFRFKDPMDYKSSAKDDAIGFMDQVLGTWSTDTATGQFQLVKTYTIGALTFTRPITKPVVDSLLISVNGVQLLSAFSVDTTTGIVSITSDHTNGHIVRAGYEFDVPVRFSSDEFIYEFINKGFQSVSIGIEEIRI